MNQDLQQYLSSTAIIDSDHPSIQAYAADSVKGAADDPVEKAVKL